MLAASVSFTGSEAVGITVEQPVQQTFGTTT